MPVTTADVPGADKPATDKPAPKPETKSKSTKALADAAASSDPAVHKLMWDRGAILGGSLNEFANVAEGHDERQAAAVEAIDVQLRELGFDV